MIVAAVSATGAVAAVVAVSATGAVAAVVAVCPGTANPACPVSNDVGTAFADGRSAAAVCPPPRPGGRAVGIGVPDGAAGYFVARSPAGVGELNISDAFSYAGLICLLTLYILLASPSALPKPPCCCCCLGS